VTGPGTAVAFTRLVAAGAAATPATVGGLATLLDGAPLGRALAGVVDAARATGAPHPVVTPTAPPAPADGDAAPVVTRADRGPPRARRRRGASGRSGRARIRGRRIRGRAHAGELLADALGRVAEQAVGGRAESLRAAIAALGGEHAAPARPGVAPDAEPSVRALLSALAALPGADRALAGAAAGLADAIGAQPLAGQAGGGPPGVVIAPHGGVYVQLPLPGGGTAELRVDPEGRRGSDGGTEKATGAATRAAWRCCSTCRASAR